MGLTSHQCVYTCYTSLRASNQPGHYKQSYHKPQLSLMYSCCQDKLLAPTNRPSTRPPITPQLLLMACAIIWPSLLFPFCMNVHYGWQNLTGVTWLKWQHWRGASSNTDWVANYTDSRLSPSVLPGKFQDSILEQTKTTCYAIHYLLSSNHVTLYSLS